MRNSLVLIVVLLGCGGVTSETVEKCDDGSDAGVSISLPDAGADALPTCDSEAEEICGDFLDNNCNDAVDEGCWSFCEPFSTPYVGDAYGWYSGCCAEKGSFRKGDSVIAKGTLIKGDDWSGAPHVVYYLASDGKRYVFPLTVNLVSWFGELDADGVPIADAAICGKVVEYPGEVIAGIPIGGNVTIRPGTFVTGITTNPKRYIVSRGQKLRRLYDLEPETAPLFQDTLWKRTVLTPDAFFVNYSIGADINGPADYEVEAELAVTLEQDLGLAP